MLWCFPKQYPDKIILNYRSKEQQADHYIFMHGKFLPWDSGNPNLTATHQEPKEYDLILYSRCSQEQLLKYDCVPNNTAGHSPIVNQRTLNFLSNFCPGDFQAFPVVIRNENSKLPDFENHNYHLLNITHCVDAIDREKSEGLEYYASDGHLDTFKNLRFKDNALEVSHLARIDIWTPAVLVSPELATLFKKSKITGVRFATDEEVYP